MKQFFTLLVFLMLQHLCHATEQPSIPAGSPEVAYTGRIVRLAGATPGDPGKVQLAFPGVEIRLRFTGPKLVLKGESNSVENRFNGEIDGRPRPRLDLPEGAFEITVADGLDESLEHEVRLIRRNEAWQGTVVIEKWILPEGGRFLAPPLKSQRRIICMGDSITCGAGVEFLPPYAAEGNHNSNAGASYGWMLAEAFDAQVHLVSYGGKGVARDWQGLTTEVRAIEFFERAHPDLPETTWDHTAYEPDLVTICFGTNDYSSGKLEPGEFYEGYKELVARIHTVHPQAKILMITSPMLAGYDKESAAQLLQELHKVVAHFAETNDTSGQTATEWLRIFEMGAYAGTEWDSHPVIYQHRAMAKDLEPVIAEWLDWTPVVE